MGYVYLYTGNGAGKTCNALGLALRCIGHGKKVVIVQFLKWWKNTGEYKARKVLPNYEIYQFGRKGWIGLNKLNDEDKRLAKSGLKFAEKALKKKPDLLVLDEINLAVGCNIIDEKDVAAFLKEVPKNTTVVMTGRSATKKLLKMADFVNEVRDVKHPRVIPTTKGIQY
jgi:cob(I)alamin adenosyltransferase